MTTPTGPRVSDEHLATVIRTTGIDKPPEEWYGEPSFSTWVMLDLRDARAELATLRQQLREMVEKAADEKLDGYRELGARAAQAENERDDARAALRLADQARLAAEAERDARPKPTQENLAGAYGLEGERWEKRK